MCEYPYFVIRHFAAFYERQACPNPSKSREELIEAVYYYPDWKTRRHV